MRGMKMALTEQASEIDLRICALDRALKLADISTGWEEAPRQPDAVVDCAKKFEAYLRGN